MNSDPAIAAGTVLFGAYEIVNEIGSGGMGRVYCAKHLNFGELRAVKVVRRGGGMDARLEEMLVREAKSLIKLNHDALVRCYELLRDEQRLYLVMEYVEGPSLQRLLLRGPLPDDEVLTLRTRILQGLAAIHDAGVVHRDISTANIVLPDGAPEHAKIIDFGLAAAEVADAKRGFQGNPVYASPEQYGLFGGKVDANSDLYSLGLVLAEATLGEPLDPGPSAVERKAFRKSTPGLPEYVPPALAAAILPLLEADPKKRPANAQKALERRVAVEDYEPEVEDADEEERRSRSKAIVFCASAVVAGIIAGALLWLWKFTNVLARNNPPGQAIARVSPAPAAPVIVGQPQPPQAPPPAPTLPPPTTQPPAPGRITRAEVMQTAQQLAVFEWSPAESNLTARCRLRAPYRPRWRAQQPVKGIPYAWGGIDGPDEFRAKLSRGLAAGSHSRHGIAPCTAGIDCSGYVMYCWGLRGSHAYTTATLYQIADRLEGNAAGQLRPGDVLNRPGKHVMLFAGLQADGRPLLYEAAGAPARVVRRDDLSWSRLRAYSPMRFRSIAD